jgi:hypothetical protein
LGMAIFAMFVGVISGVVIHLPEKAWRVYVITTITTLGITSLVIAVRATVLATYKELPTLLAGQGTSYFELCYLVCIVLMVSVIWVTHRILK